MDYDEIDQFVDSLFAAQDQAEQDSAALYGDVISGDWANDRIDQIIQAAYDDAMRWHNQRISEGADPQSGLHGLPYIPWDERIDGVAAMQGAIGGIQPVSSNRASPIPDVNDNGWGCLEIGAVIAVVLFAVTFMVFIIK